MFGFRAKHDHSWRAHHRSASDPRRIAAVIVLRLIGAKCDSTVTAVKGIMNALELTQRSCTLFSASG
jgi:hypothetical protein